VVTNSQSMLTTKLKPNNTQKHTKINTQKETKTEPTGPNPPVRTTDSSDNLPSHPAHNHDSSVIVYGTGGEGQYTEGIMLLLICSHTRTAYEHGIRQILLQQL